MINKMYYHSFSNGLQANIIHTNQQKFIDIQIWIKVGSAQETALEYGICHMIEHMIFKGSKEIALGELDAAMYQLNGFTNAFTTKEFTAYTFSIPDYYFDIAMKIIDMVFTSPRFDTEDLEVEKQVVIQEILSYQDDPFSVLLDNAFQYAKCHPSYKHPILGSIETVSSFSTEQLKTFYLKYYTAANITYFITGNITKNNAIQKIKDHYFATLPKIEIKNTLIEQTKIKYTKKKLSHYAYSSSTNNHFLITYTFKSQSYHFFYLYKALDILLGADKDSLLYKKLCIDLKLTSTVKTFFYTFVQETFFFVYFVPINLSDLPFITQNIYNIIDELKKHYLDEKTIEKIYNVLYFDFCMLKTEQCEDFIFDKLPYIITERNNYLRHPITKETKKLAKQIAQIAKKLVHKNLSINAVINNQYNPSLLKNQISKNITQNNFTTDNIAFETDIKNQETIQTSLEKIIKNMSKRIVKNQCIKNKFQIRKRQFPAYCELTQHINVTLSNDMQLIFIDCYDKKDELICISLSLDIKHYYQDKDLQGSLGFLFDLMYCGTKSHPGQSFIDYIEQYGIYFSWTVGEIIIRCLQKYWKEALNILIEYLTEPELSETFFHIIKLQTIEAIHNFNDDQMIVLTQFNKEILYENHPFSQNPGGTIESIEKITHQSILDTYHTFIFPNKAICVFNGVFTTEQQNEIRTELLKFQNKKKISLILPAITQKPTSFIHEKYIDKQQVAISLVGYSAKQYSKDYYCLLLAEQVICGTLVSSMNSLLFSLRELFGYFYHIHGSLTYNCTKEPGIFMIQAMTSHEFYQNSIDLIKKLLLISHKFIHEYDIYVAKQALLLHITNKNELRSTQNSYIINIYKNNFTEKDLQQNYYTIIDITKEDIIFSLKKYINESNLYTTIIRKY